MSANVNRVMLAGNLTRDPQVRMLPGDKAVANFGIAVNERYKGKDGEQKESTVFVDVEAWGRTAELVGQYLTKGRSCFIEGRLKLDVWEKDGQKHSKLKVVADSVQFLDSKRESEASAPAPAATSPAPAKPKPIKTTPAAGFTDDSEPPF